MLTAQTLRRIRQIELRTRRLVSESFAGAYHSVFKGRGIAFDSVRPYEVGDDVRDIDWKVTARAGEPFVKRYVEERELVVMLVLDSSVSTMFGTVSKYKRDLAAELGAVLAYSAISNNDKVGLLVFSDRVEQYISPRKGKNHVSRLIRDLLAAKSEGKGTDISLALKTVNQLLKRRSIVFLLSDFLASGKEYARDLLVASRRHDVIAVTLSDPREYSWPAVGLVGLTDAETGGVKWVDTSARDWRQQFEQQVTAFQEMRDQVFRRSEVDCIEVPADGDYIHALTIFFRQRERRSRR
jgi:uncharacterized protein (DUF58 family)